MKICKKIAVEETYSVRLNVLRKQIDLPYKFDGDLKESTFHLGVFEEERIVGVASFIKNSNPLIDIENQYQLRGMATLEEVRGLGFGVRLLKMATTILKEKKSKILWCNAREVALPFYLKNGFKIIGNPFVINKIGTHFALYKKV